MSDCKIIIFGDICPDNDYRTICDEKKCFSEDIKNDIAEAKLSVANLECPATDNDIAITKCGPSLRALPKDIVYLKELGFDVLSLANNHILDYGIEGIEDTLSNCKKEDIKTVGAGKTKYEAEIPVICDVGDKKVGIISFAEAEFNLAMGNLPGANHFDPYDSYDKVQELKEKSDYVVVLYHGGIEHYKNPSPLLQKKCRKFAKSGADLVLCQHSHCIGTLEKIDDCTIIYGQGNSLFGYREGNDAWNEGFAVEVDLNSDEKVSLKLLKATENGICYASVEESNKRIEQMMTDSEKINDSEWIENEWIVFAKNMAALNLPMLFGRSRVFNKLNRILKNKLINIFYSRKKMMVSMNLIRCEAHHEVMQTILEERFF